MIKFTLHPEKLQVTFLYTARRVFDKNYGGEVMAWEKYLEWSKLTHLTELISLDINLNEVLVGIDYESQDYWENSVVGENEFETSCFKTLEYVLLNNKAKDKFNLLTVVIEPQQDCKINQLNDYDFIGYELLDKDYSTSALSNCGGFNETFLPRELNNFGLIDEFEKAYDLKKRLLENNPNEFHADTNVIAVWRHKIIGKKK